MIFEKFHSVEEFHHQCQDYLEIRERTVGKGSAYVKQCTFCGCQKGQSIPKASVSSVPKSFDITLAEKYDSKYTDAKNEASPRPILANAPSSTFDLFEQKIDNVIDEFLSDLDSYKTIDKASLINSFLTRKSDQYHKQKRSDWQSENQIKEWFSQTFSQWFYIYPEVNGVGHINGIQKRIRIDYVIIAKPELIDAGFTSKAVGIEAKFFKFQTGDGFTKSASSGVFQALSYWYSNSTWEIPNESQSQLACVMMLSNLSFKSERETLKAEPGRGKERQWGAFLNLANNANVGEIHYEFGYQGCPDSWAFKFGGSTYFSRYKTKGFKAGNHRLIDKKRIGNFR